ncbi:acetyl-CoA synthetase-like protein [Trametes cingulata]|nr:acetyl-CoA synthetase-like protein [Trametes cingulata]
MEEIHGDGGPLPPIPDDLTIHEFILDTPYPSRPVPRKPQPWLIEEKTGREIGSDELRARVFGLANALKTRWNIGQVHLVPCIFSPNHVGAQLPHCHPSYTSLRTANPSYTAEELVYQLDTTKAKLLFVHPANLSIALDAVRAIGIPADCVVLFDPVPGSTRPNVQDLVVRGLRETQQFTERRLKAGEAKTKLALLCFSSGTTGKAKAVMIPHYSIIANVIQMAQHLRLTDETMPSEHICYKPGSVTLAVLPFFHLYGMHMILFGSMFFASTVVVSQKFELEQMLESVQRYRVTHLYLVPPMALLMCKARPERPANVSRSCLLQSPVTKNYDLSSVYFLMVGAAPVSAELTEQLIRVLPQGCWIGQGYGMSELATCISFHRPDQKIGTLGCAGVLLPGIIARVVKQDGSRASFGEPGELHLKSPSMSLGYLNNTKATAETFRDGWLITGDEVTINEKKEIFVVDRIKELIKVRGYQVAPAELEGHLLDHPDIADVCVVGIPDQYSGELPFAFVVLRAETQARIKHDPAQEDSVRASIMKHVTDHKVYYKRLAGVEFVDSVPKNPSGKLLRRILRDQAKAMLAKGQLKLAPKAKL